MPRGFRAIPFGRGQVIVNSTLSNLAQAAIAHAYDVRAVPRSHRGERRFGPRTQDLHVGDGHIDS